MAKYARAKPDTRPPPPPAPTPEGREKQLISLALEVLEERLRNRTASAQEITQLLRMGSVEARIERDILIQQQALITAKTESIRNTRKVDELYANAIAAMRSYAGESDDDLAIDNHED